MLKVVLDARISPGTHGGIEQTIIGLIKSLANYADSGVKLIIVVLKGCKDWILPYTSSDQEVIEYSEGSTKERLDGFKNLFGKLRPYLGHLKRRITHPFKSEQPSEVVIPTDSFFEHLKADVIHIIYPLNYFYTKTPTVFTIHDLNHKHLDYFNDTESGRRHVAWRETIYPHAFQHSAHIIAISDFTRKDVIHWYQVDAQKISTIRWGGISGVYTDNEQQFVETELRLKYNLPSRFLLFPSVTYQHKNHINLLKAIHLLKVHFGEEISLICTGKKAHYWPEISKVYEDLALQTQVQFLDHLEAQEFAGVFKMANGIIMPSKFEGAGLGLLDAIEHQKPLYCSDIPAFREYGEHIPVYFDPENPMNIAKAIQQYFLNETEINAFKLRYASFTPKWNWEVVASDHLAVYKAAAKQFYS